MNDSLSIAHTCLPKDVRQLPVRQIDNFMLKYYKAARFDPDYDRGKGKFFFFRNDKRTKGEQEFGDTYKINAEFGHLDWPAMAARQKAFVGAVCQQAVSFDFEPDTRMVIGIGGGGSVYEVGITLHHTYGCPYIPSSSIKGIVRSWIIAELFSAPDTNEEKDFPMVNAEHRAYQNAMFCLLFGCPAETQAVKFKDGKPVKKKDKQGAETKEYDKDKGIPVGLKDKEGKGQEHQGVISFFDALPKSKPVIEVDIMNPHYPDWYDGSKLPADTQNPRPIPFLTIGRGSEFQLYFGCNTSKPVKDLVKDVKDCECFVGNNTGLTLNSSLTEVVAYWLKAALTTHGIGAKTAVGYGYMKAQEQPSINTGATSTDSMAKQSNPTIDLKEGLEIEVEVAEVKFNGEVVKATHPTNKLQQVQIKSAPKTLQPGDKVIVRCKLKKNNNGLDFFEFIGPK